jgi:hypothetical protein
MRREYQSLCQTVAEYSQAVLFLDFWGGKPRRAWAGSGAKPREYTVSG